MTTRLTHALMRQVLAALVFGMAFLLTPRVMVESRGAEGVADHIPVEMLKHPDHDCLWCAPMVPVKCGEASGQDSARLWLNPDEAPAAQQPCIEPVVGAAPETL